MVRFAWFAMAALAACGRIGFDERMPLHDSGSGGSAVDATDGQTSDGDIGGTGSFGTMQVGISTQNTGADRVWISRFMLTEPAQVHTIVVHAGPSGGQASTLRGIMYADAAGAPAALLGTTDEVALLGASQPGWLALPFATPVPLVPGAYWLGTQNAVSIRIAYQSATGTTTFGNDVYADGPDATYAGGGAFTMELSIYAEYTR